MSATPQHRVWLHGLSGRMGKEIQKLFAEGRAPSLRLIGGSGRTFDNHSAYQRREVSPELLSQALTKDEVGVIPDFSNAAGNQVLLESMAKVHHKAVVLGTTGIPSADLVKWKQLAESNKLKLLIAPNTSIGILLTAKAALLAAGPLKHLGFDIEITETHHKGKADAPSGTARFLANTLADGIGGLEVVTDRHGARKSTELGVHSVRGGGIFGEHEIRIIGDSEEVRISHPRLQTALCLRLALWSWRSGSSNKSQVPTACSTLIITTCRSWYKSCRRRWRRDPALRSG